MKQAYWIWFPGDMEIHHGMMQNFSREERGFSWPAYWNVDDCKKNINFRRNYELTAVTVFSIHSYSIGYVLVNDQKYPLNTPITCGPGFVRIVVHAANPSGLPSIYVKGDIIYSDCQWSVDDYICEPVAAGWCEHFTSETQNPEIWEYNTCTYHPDLIETVGNGVLYHFPVEITASLKLEFTAEFFPLQICYGETRNEALDTHMCYYSQSVNDESETIPVRAFRYIYIPNIREHDLKIEAIHHFVDIPIRARFTSDNELMNRIWQVSEWTFRLCSGIFFIDGAKRDKWIWSGDAYQAYFVNQYLMADAEIDKRTILALRGNDPIRTHMNTIIDYSLLWIVGIHQHYLAYGDLEFVRMVYPKMISLMEFCDNQLDENGFVVGREKDWTFIDWGTIDKDGAVCAEQILFARCFEVMEYFDLKLNGGTEEFKRRKELLKASIKSHYWDPALGAYIDSFSSGKRNVSRQTNVFAILFGLADEKEADSICRCVLDNDQIPAITTPYFKFYEMEVLCQCGYLNKVYQQVSDYWGGMLSFETTTFWEEFDPAKENQMEMYGDVFGKSMCHAWAASPIYLIGRYFMGIEPLEPGYKTFRVDPRTDLFTNFEVEFPIGDGSLSMKLKDGRLSVMADRDGGGFFNNGTIYELQKNKAVEILL